MDRIIAVYVDDQVANQVRQHLFADGFPVDRIDVVTWDDAGRFVDNPKLSREDNRVALFSMLLPDAGELPVIESVVSSLREGKASVIVHPRGTVEIDMAREVLHSHLIVGEVWRVDPPESQGGLLGEHAAGG